MHQPPCQTLVVAGAAIDKADVDAVLRVFNPHIQRQTVDLGGSGMDGDVRRQRCLEDGSSDCKPEVPTTSAERMRNCFMFNISGYQLTRDYFKDNGVNTLPELTVEGFAGAGGSSLNITFALRMNMFRAGIFRAG